MRCKDVVGLQTLAGYASKPATGHQPARETEAREGTKRPSERVWPKRTARTAETTGPRLLAPLLEMSPRDDVFSARRPARDGCFFRPEAQVIIISKRNKAIVRFVFDRVGGWAIIVLL